MAVALFVDSIDESLRQTIFIFRKYVCVSANTPEHGLRADET
jgi:hypothetical protein